MASVQMRVEGERFRDLSRELRKTGRGDLRKQLTRGVREASKPVVQDVQSAARRVRVSSPEGGHQRPDRSTGLRDRVARATGVSATQKGIKIRVSPKKFGEYGTTLPKYLDASLNSYKRWRHPVFGNENVWAIQQGDPFFGKTIKKHARDFRGAITKAMDDVADEIED